MKVITINPTSIKDIRKAMRSLESWHETLLINGICQIIKTGNTGYSKGPTPENDDSNPYTDYSAWSYCLKEKWILDDLKQYHGIA